MTSASLWLLSEVDKYTVMMSLYMLAVKSITALRSVVAYSPHMLMSPSFLHCKKDSNDNYCVPVCACKKLFKTYLASSPVIPFHSKVLSTCTPHCLSRGSECTKVKLHSLAICCTRSTEKPS